ncbi:thiol:disulfide interchange protein DsbA/DsbL [Chromobacterium amazonense]|uniref:thiol:disulfide interchange protein DsbA/DsbL n=1 Tax=Chromobacterium amazonense TaxID=1382803 RepID=UPI0031F6D99B
MKALAFIWFVLVFDLANAQLVEGRDYKILAKPHLVSSGGKIEVVEYFAYSCVHCRAQDAALTDWEKILPADVQLLRRHVVWGKSMEGLARAFATINAAGALHSLHGAAFEAVQHDRIDLGKEAEFEKWLKKCGVADVGNVMAIYRSFSVASQVQAMAKFTRVNRIFSVPMLVVDGKYMVTAAQPKQAQKVLDALLSKVRGQRLAQPSLGTL